MKRQTLLLAMIFCFVLLVLLAVAGLLRSQVRRAEDPAQRRTVSLGDFSLIIPGAFGGGRAYRDKAWEVRDYSGGDLGILRLAKEPSDGSPWEHLCARWFAMPAYAPGPLRFEARGAAWFFKEVPLFGRGAYVLRKQGKGLRFIAFFEREGTRHWLSLDTRNTLTPQKDLFDGILLSLRAPDGTAPDPSLVAALRAIQKESGFRFIQPLAFFLLLPVAVLALIALIQGLVRWRAGRLPESFPAGAKPSFFSEEGVEIGLARPFQRKFLDCAVVLTADDLVVYTFGTPLLTVPRQDWKGRVETGNAWLGLPFVKLGLAGSPIYHKWNKLHGARKAPLILRLYTREAERLRTLLEGL